MGKMNPAYFNDDEKLACYFMVTDLADARIREIEAAGLLPQFKDFNDEVTWPDVLAYVRAEIEKLDIDPNKTGYPTKVLEGAELICQEGFETFMQKHLTYPIPAYQIQRGLREILNRKRTKQVWTPNGNGYGSDYFHKSHNENGRREIYITLYYDPERPLSEAALWWELSKKITEETIDVYEILLAHHHRKSGMVIDPVSGELRSMITLPQIAKYLGEPISGGHASRVLDRIREHVMRLSEIKLTLISSEWYQWKDEETGKIIRAPVPRFRVSGIDGPPLRLFDYRSDWVLDGRKLWNEFYYKPGDALSLFLKHTPTRGHLASLRLEHKYKYAKRAARYLGAYGFYAGQKGRTPWFKIKKLLGYIGIDTGIKDRGRVVATANDALKKLFEIRYLYAVPDLKIIYDWYRGDYQRWLEHSIGVMLSPNVAPIREPEQLPA